MVVLGIYLVVAGIVRFIRSFTTLEDRALQMALGIIDVILGILILSLPELSLVTLAILFAISLLIRGAFMVWVAFKLRGARHGSEPALPSPPDLPERMAWVPGGEFAMGSEAFYPEGGAGAARRGRGLLDRRVAGDGGGVPPVREGDRLRLRGGTAARPDRLPGRRPRRARARRAGLPAVARAGRPARLPQLVGVRAGHDLGAAEGPASDTYTRGRHPVTQVAYEDAQAYAAWAGKELPTEAEWEYAARGGLVGAVFAWGDEFAPEGRMMANTWQGEFPWQNLMSDGYAGTSPVGSFPPNGYGLYDMTGNVWEWTCDEAGANGAARPCCAPSEAGEHIPRRVIKGGSHLCAPNYCLRYRPAARQFEAVDTSTGHIGFRCVVRDG